MFYNFCRIHKTLRMSPAMAAGVTNQLWPLEDVIARIDADAAPAKPRGPYKKAGVGGMSDISKAVLGAAIILGIAIYAGNSPRYQIVPAGGGQAGAFVVEQSTGKVRWCNGVNCVAQQNSN